MGPQYAFCVLYHVLLYTLLSNLFEMSINLQIKIKHLPAFKAEYPRACNMTEWIYTQLYEDYIYR